VQQQTTTKLSCKTDHQCVAKESLRFPNPTVQRECREIVKERESAEIFHFLLRPASNDKDDKRCCNHAIAQQSSYSTPPNKAKQSQRDCQRTSPSIQTLTSRLGFFRNQPQIHKSSTEDTKNEQLTNKDARARTHNPKKETVSQDYYLARGPRFETQQIEKIELDQIPFSSHTRPSTLRLLLAFHTVDQQPLSSFPTPDTTKKKILKNK